MHRHVACKPSFFSKLFILLEGIVFFPFLFLHFPFFFFPSFLCSTIVSEEGWLSEDAYCIYIRYLMHVYGCTYPNRIIFLRTYLRTYSYLQSVGGILCVSECMCVCEGERERESEKAKERKSA